MRALLQICSITTINYFFKKYFFRVEQEKQAIPPPPALGSPHTKVQTPPQPSPRRPGRPPLHLKRKMNGSTSPVRKRQYKQMRKEHGKHIYPEGDNTTVHEQPTIRKEVFFKCFNPLLFND